MGKHADPIATRRVVCGVLAWALLSLAWFLVLRRQTSTWLPQLLVPAVALVVVTAVTVAWVRHNLGIYQRKGSRRGLPHVAAPWVSDSLGRPLVFAPGVDDARIVRLELEGATKRYEVGL